MRGVRVADFTWVGAGPFMTKPLADHGADVIKIESRVKTDVIRGMAPFAEGEPGVNRSGYFANRNSSKRSVCLDLRSPEGRELALRLISVSDVVANNFTPGTMDRLGLGYESARAVRPDIVYLDMPMQGNTGPHRDHRGFGLSIGAAGGLLAQSGYPDRPPVGTGTNYPDHVPNPLHAAIAVLVALRRRRRTGHGQHIELSQLESTLNAIGPDLVAASAGRPVGRRGNDDDLAAPHGVFPCAGEDRWCAIAVVTDEHWHGLVTALGRPSWADDPALTSAGGRRAASARLSESLRQTVLDWDAEKLADTLAEAGVPAALVADAAYLLYSDPQLAARGHWVSLRHPEMGACVYDGIPYRLSRTPGSLRSPAPLLGADTRAVCTELLGVADTEYDRLAEQGVVG
ncbi:CaiB/BaiF CoA transferase family protein [Prauserella shujinwangii]|uniref:CaiB/BaiF CoA transferase family protein n=1 Tax=Prauserella shujinwangii TaxID=1453103 RepID=UPI002481F7A6|nr:CoA transferase [Prauserella shujinwangii]